MARVGELVMEARRRAGWKMVGSEAVHLESGWAVKWSPELGFYIKVAGSAATGGQMFFMCDRAMAWVEQYCRPVGGADDPFTRFEKDEMARVRDRDHVMNAAI